MNLWKRIQHAGRVVFRRNKVDAEMAEEMRFHRDAQIDTNLTAGMSRQEATRAANLQFGHIDAVAEEGREARGFAWLTHLQQDLRYGVRMLLQQKECTFVAVMTLALGLSANITIFAIIDTFFFQPLAEVQKPSALVVLIRETNSRPTRPGLLLKTTTGRMCRGWRMRWRCYFVRCT
ncbi:MAG: hypothetical protein J6386_16995 [Candidatus Synoicihabitans palmerolidicus]|nr:hypothetical protein [Candidatus Synoicihabitans palmerolidicus]